MVILSEHRERKISLDSARRNAGILPAFFFVNSSLDPAPGLAYKRGSTAAESDAAFGRCGMGE
jgi:hypothetical protein